MNSRGSSLLKYVASNFGVNSVWISLLRLWSIPSQTLTEPNHVGLGKSPTASEFLMLRQGFSCCLPTNWQTDSSD
ncbi:unnamed protein product [Phytomonas sp. Hart1]|nr:unnamed protein product [Phytomonas sp. Hart1]|eukprot:CCW67132.1 unnamed protein product [Phytomonas sp. isolate Hart1]